ASRGAGWPGPEGWALFRSLGLGGFVAQPAPLLACGAAGVVFKRVAPLSSGLGARVLRFRRT
ncbi:MAG: hypothetical protein DRK00_06615, partial [Thermoprotei archaeon]